MHRTFNLSGLQIAARHNEMKMDTREYFRVVRCAIRGDFNYAVGDRRPRFTQDVHDVVSSAPAGSDEYHFHRACAEIATSTFGGSVHDHSVAAFRFADEGDVFQ